MKILKKSEKSRGVVLFAFNTESVNYVEIARRSSRLIRKALSLPVCLITDTNITDKTFDTVICVDNNFKNYRSGGKNWRNGNRFDAFFLSPYDETILIDSDYLLLDNNLLKLLDCTNDYRIFYDNNFLNSISESHIMGKLSLPYVWATAIVFKKTDKSRAMFSMVERIQNNYSFYRKLYQISMENYRNDFAFTIANHVINGYISEINCSIPWKMTSVDDKIKSIEKNKNHVVIRNKDKVYVTPMQSIHVLDKEYLLSDNFNNFVDSICQE